MSERLCVWNLLYFALIGIIPRKQVQPSDFLVADSSRDLLIP